MNRTEPTRQSEPSTTKVSVITQEPYGQRRQAASLSSMTAILKRFFDWKRFRDDLSARHERRTARAHRRSMSSREGLIQKIENARSENQINALLKVGEGFDRASDDTRRKWDRAANRRRTELATA